MAIAMKWKWHEMRWRSKKRPEIPLRSILVVPFILQIVGAVGLVGYLSFKNGQQAVNDLADNLMDKTSHLVDCHLDSYLAIPAQINQLNLKAIEQGLLDVKDVRGAGRFFWQQVKIYDVSFIGYALATGEYTGAGKYLPNKGITIDEISAATKGIAYVYGTDDRGNITKVIETYPDYKPTEEAWYTEGIKANKQVWTSVYNWDDSPEILAATINSPIYDRNNRKVGAIGVDLMLSKISKFLSEIKVSPGSKIFIIERDGSLIASSSSEQPFTMVNGVAQRLKVSNSTEPAIANTAQYLQNKFGDFKQIQQNQRLDFDLDGKRQFLKVTPWQDRYGLDWLVVVVVPENDFMAKIDANRQTTELLCLATLIVTTGLGLLTSNWIARPIDRITKASVAIANGNLNQQVKIKGIKELKTLAESFNFMAQQLQDSFASRDRVNHELENRVQQRTGQLKKAVQAAMRAASQSAADKKAAENANRAKSEFLANMSHELRTPLNAILGFTQILERDRDLTVSQKENLGIINKSGEHLLALINDVLDMSKIEAGRLTIAECDFDLDSLLQLLHDMFQLRAKAKNLHFAIERDPCLPRYLKTDEKKLRQVLINLLANAIKFTEQGTVTLRVNSEAGNFNDRTETNRKIKLTFAIKDTGSGIAEDELALLFKPFSQTKTGRASQQGTGLGLAISDRFARLLGGEITCESVLSRGTTFTLHLPVKLGQAIETSIQTQRRRVVGLAPGQKEYRILIVDDRSTNREILVKLLQPLGFAVREAENGQVAIALWETWQPDLIWMDMQMPVVNGYEAAQTIKSHLRGQATIIIALTASVFEEERSLVLSAGCDDFVRKPFTIEVIFEKMADYLGVRYLYEDISSSEFNSLPPTSNEQLSAQSLTVMDKDWCDRLQQAAAQLDERLLAGLIAEIPQESAFMAQELQAYIDNFDFEVIVNLAREAILL
jgi:signal transduction histidine kinase/CheY-like chemotaxis protein